MPLARATPADGVCDPGRRLAIPCNRPAEDKNRTWWIGPEVDESGNSIGSSQVGNSGSESHSR